MATAASPGHRILIAHSYYLRYDPKQQKKRKPYPPLGTLIAAAAARNDGHDVHLFDAMLSEGVAQFALQLAALQPRIVALLEDNFNFLTKMCTLRMREAACAMIAQAKRSGCRVIVNGSDASDQPAYYLSAGADVVITGAVEPALLELIRLWREDSSAPADLVKGVVLPPAPGSTEVRRTASRPPLDDLDALPFPAWDLVDAERYRSVWRPAHGRLSWNMVTSRGCPYGCNWCAKPLFGRRYIQRSPGNVAEELRRLKRDVEPDHIWFADDIFGLTPAWIEAFAQAVERLDAYVPFTIQTRVNLMRPATVAALRRAGAEEVWLGVESGSQRILDAMEKGTTVEQVRTATRELKAQGVRVGWFLQLGYLGEEWEDLLRTRELVASERPDDIGVSVSYPLPGTPFHEAVRAHLGAKRNWEHTDDLDMLFHGTYGADFYRMLRDLLHDEVASWSRGGSSEAYAERWEELTAEQSDHINPVLRHV